MKHLHLHPVEKEKALARCDLFEGLTSQERFELAGVARCTEYDRGEILFVKDEPAQSLFIVSKGKLKIYCLSPDGREQIVHIINPGEVCAEVPMFSGGAYPVNAVAMAKTEVLTFSRQNFLAQAREKPEILMNMLANISRRLRFFVNLVDDLSLKDVGSRLARFLLAHARDGQVILRESKKTLAGQLGTVPETLSRTLHQFQEKGLVSVEGKTIELLNCEQLKIMLDEL